MLGMRCVVCAMGLASLAAASGQPAPPVAAPARAAAKPQSVTCTDEYADDLSALSPAARSVERSREPYTVCVRSAATYECPYFAPDGSLRRARRIVTSHGTAFGLRQQAGETLLVTAQHVAEWPAVTYADHAVADVPNGCRRVSEALSIVKNEADDYTPDDIPLALVVADPLLDVAVVKASTALPVIPWRLGRSAGLRERNTVSVRGFPLGALRADSVGKVVSAKDHDTARDWDHDDFVVDALLSPGHSGSPVMAVSCKSGEFELVGVYHAGYTRGTALNVVVGIDQLTGLLTSLRRTPRPPPASPEAVDAAARAELVAGVAGEVEHHFLFGPTTASVLVRGDGALVFVLHPKDFPVQSTPLAVLEDLPGEADAFGSPGRTWLGSPRGLRVLAWRELEDEAQAHLAKLRSALRTDALAALRYRSASRESTPSRARFEEVRRLERSLRGVAVGRADLVQATVDLRDRLARTDGQLAGTLAEALAVPARPSDVPPTVPAELLPLSPSAAPGTSSDEWGR